MPGALALILLRSSLLAAAVVVVAAGRPARASSYTSAAARSDAGGRTSFRIFFHAPDEPAGLPLALLWSCSGRFLRCLQQYLAGISSRIREATSQRQDRAHLRRIGNYD